MEDVIQTCPKCQSSNVSIRDLKFKVNSCGHSICHKCVDLIFRSQGNEENCPKCGETLQKSEFRDRKFESDEVESYIHYHQMVHKIYNCVETDFQTLDQYNDYLEDVETLIHDLMDKDKREEARNKLKGYKHANREDIKIRRNRKNKDFEIYEQLEKEQDERRTKAEDNMRREKENREQIDEEFAKILMVSDNPLQDLMQKCSQMKQEKCSKVEEEKSRDAVSRGVKRPVCNEGVIYQYTTPSYMSQSPFDYDLYSGINTDVLHQSMKPGIKFFRGGGYTHGFWMSRLQYFSE